MTTGVVHGVPGRNDRRYEQGRAEGHRTQSQRDRDRVLYTSAFRRLAGVTQVVSASEGHLFHTRLTHTLEVAQIGRRLAEKVLSDQGEVAQELGGIDPEVVEAAALAHDLGHPPFGHIAEVELDRLVIEAGAADGFEGNPQSFRIITKLAVRHADEPGLNLTRATLNAVLKYPWFRGTAGTRHRKWGAYSTEEPDFRWARELSPGDDRKSAEAELMDVSDDIAYAIHDVEDFYRARLIPLEKLVIDESEVERFLVWVWDYWNRDGRSIEHPMQVLRDTFLDITSLLPISEAYSGAVRQRAALRTLTSGLIGRYVEAIKIRIPTDESPVRILVDDWVKVELFLLKQLTWYYVITNPELSTQQYGQKHIIRELFRIFAEAADSKTLELFPHRYRDEFTRLVNLEGDQLSSEQVTRERIRLVADLIAGYTEPQAVAVYQRLSGTSPGAITDITLR